MSFPNWLNKEFVQKCLRSSTCDPQLSIVKINISYGCNTQRSYTSGLFRVKLLLRNGQNEEKTLSFILKCSKDGNLISNLMEDYFRTEIYVFKNVLPRVEKLLSAAGYLDSFYPTYICSGDEPVHFLMLEDLTESCHDLSRVREGLDLQHCLLVVRTIAKHHAATAFILQRDSKIRDVLKESVMTSEALEKKYDDILPKIPKVIAKCASEWPDFPEDLFQRVRNFTRTSFSKVRDVSVYRNDKFNVILHGDFWNNNLMFKYTQNKVESVKILDFQASFVSSPVYDLMFFMYSSFSHDDFNSGVDLLIGEYHKELSQALKLLNYDGISYTLSDLKDDVKEYAAVGAFAAMYVLPWVLANESEGIDMSTAVENLDEIHKLFANAFLYKTFRLKLANLIENNIL